MHADIRDIAIHGRQLKLKIHADIRDMRFTADSRTLLHVKHHIEWRKKENMIIERVSENDDRTGDFINEAFTDYAKKSEVALNFEEYTFAAKNEEGDIIGVITGRAYYNEVHIGDLIVDEMDHIGFIEIGSGLKVFVLGTMDVHVHLGIGKGIDIAVQVSEYKKDQYCESNEYDR